MRRLNLSFAKALPVPFSYPFSLPGFQKGSKKASAVVALALLGLSHLSMASALSRKAVATLLPKESDLISHCSWAE